MSRCGQNFPGQPATAPWPRVLHGAGRKEIATLLWRIASSRAVPHQLQRYDQRLQTVPVRGHRDAVAVKQEVAELGTLGHEDHGLSASRTVAAMREDVVPTGRQRGLAVAVTLSVYRARTSAPRAAKWARKEIGRRRRKRMNHQPRSRITTRSPYQPYR
jgi:hypothetical protein